MGRVGHGTFLREPMFDDISSLEGQTQEDQNSSEEKDKPARSLSRWSHVVALVVFCLVYFPLQNHPWVWPVAIAISYSTFVFAIAIGLSLDYADDFFGDPRIPKYVAKLLLRHAPILAVITFAAWLWLRAFPTLPRWMSVESNYHHVSLWELCGVVLFWGAGIREGKWMASKIKPQLTESAD